MPRAKYKAYSSKFVFLLYWGTWFLLSVFSNYHYVITDIVSLCGIATTIAIWQQPRDPVMRKSLNNWLIISNIRYINLLDSFCSITFHTF